MKKFVTLGVLTGAVALTGLAGAAYAADSGSPTATLSSVSTTTKPGPGVGIVSCSAKQAGPADGKGKLPGLQTFKGQKLIEVKPDGKGTVHIQKLAPGKAVPALPGSPDTVKVGKDGVVIIKGGGDVRCTQVPAGTTPSGLPPLTSAK